jgi:hypothetical protein
MVEISDAALVVGYPESLHAAGMQAPLHARQAGSILIQQQSG